MLGCLEKNDVLGQEKYFFDIKNWAHQAKKSYLTIIQMEKIPELKCEKEGEGWRVGFAEAGINIEMCGDTKEEAYDAFWDYVYGLTADLEMEEKLSEDLQRERNFLRQYFYCDGIKKWKA